MTTAKNSSCRLTIRRRYRGFRWAKTCCIAFKSARRPHEPQQRNRRTDNTYLTTGARRSRSCSAHSDLRLVPVGLAPEYPELSSRHEGEANLVRLLQSSLASIDQSLLPRQLGIPCSRAIFRFRKVASLGRSLWRGRKRAQRIVWRVSCCR